MSLVNIHPFIVLICSSFEFKNLKEYITSIFNAVVKVGAGGQSPLIESKIMHLASIKSSGMPNKKCINEIFDLN